MLIAAAAVIAVSLMLIVPRIDWFKGRISDRAAEEIAERLREVTRS